MLSFHCLVKQGLFTSTLQKRKWGLGERLPQCVWAAWLLNHDLLTDCLFGASSGSQPPGAITLHPSVTLYPGSWAQPGSFACCPGFYLRKVPTAFLPCYRVAVPTKPTFGCPSSPGRTGGWVLWVLNSPLWPVRLRWRNFSSVWCHIPSGWHTLWAPEMSEWIRNRGLSAASLAPRADTVQKHTTPRALPQRSDQRYVCSRVPHVGEKWDRVWRKERRAMVKPQLGRMVRRGGLAACYPEEDSRGPAHSFTHSFTPPFNTVSRVVSLTPHCARAKRWYQSIPALGTPQKPSPHCWTWSLGWGQGAQIKSSD